MPKTYEIELKDGRVIEVDADTEPTMEEAQQAVAQFESNWKDHAPSLSMRPQFGRPPSEMLTDAIPPSLQQGERGIMNVPPSMESTGDWNAPTPEATGPTFRQLGATRGIASVPEIDEGITHPDAGQKIERPGAMGNFLRETAVAPVQLAQITKNPKTGEWESDQTEHVDEWGNSLDGAVRIENPIVKYIPNGWLKDIGVGNYNAMASFGNFMVSPQGLAFMAVSSPELMEIRGASPEIKAAWKTAANGGDVRDLVQLMRTPAGRLISAGFAVDMARGANESLGLGDIAVRRGDLAGAAQHYGGAILNGTMSALSANHAVHPGEPLMLDHAKVRDLMEQHWKAQEDAQRSALKMPMTIEGGGPLPQWARDAMVRQGLNPARTFNDIDLTNPSIVEAIKSDPSLTDAQKAEVLSKGGVSNASQVSQAAAVHGDVLPSGEAKVREMPVIEGEQGVRQETQRRIRPSLTSEVSEEGRVPADRTTPADVAEGVVDQTGGISAGTEVPLIQPQGPPGPRKTATWNAMEEAYNAGYDGSAAPKFESLVEKHGIAFSKWERARIYSAFRKGQTQRQVNSAFPGMEPIKREMVSPEGRTGPLMAHEIMDWKQLNEKFNDGMPMEHDEMARLDAYEKRRSIEMQKIIENQPAPKLDDEDQKVVEEAANEEGVKIRVGSPEDFEGNRSGARAIAAGNEVIISPLLSRLDLRGMDREQKVEAIKSLIAHEAIHLKTPRGAGEKYWNDLTSWQKKIAYKLANIEPGTVPNEAEYMGREVIARRMQRLRGMTPVEIAMEIHNGHFTRQSLEALDRIIQDVRETLGTKASKRQKAELDTIQDNIRKGIAIAGGQAQANQREEPSDAAKRFAEAWNDPNHPVTNLTDNPNVVTTIKTGMALRSVADLDTMLGLIRDNRALRKRIDSEGRKATPEEMAKLLRQQFPREVVETATNAGAWSEENQARGPVPRPLGERPLDWQTHPEVEQWLRQHGEEIGIKLPDAVESANKRPTYDLNPNPDHVDKSIASGIDYLRSAPLELRKPEGKRLLDYIDHHQDAAFEKMIDLGGDIDHHPDTGKKYWNYDAVESGDVDSAIKLAERIDKLEADYHRASVLANSNKFDDGTMSFSANRRADMNPRQQKIWDNIMSALVDFQKAISKRSHENRFLADRDAGPNLDKSATEPVYNPTLPEAWLDYFNKFEPMFGRGKGNWVDKDIKAAAERMKQAVQESVDEAGHGNPGVVNAIHQMLKAEHLSGGKSGDEQSFSANRRYGMTKRGQKLAEDLRKLAALKAAAEQGKATRDVLSFKPVTPQALTDAAIATAASPFPSFAKFMSTVQHTHGPIGEESRNSKEMADAYFDGMVKHLENANGAEVERIVDELKLRREVYGTYRPTGSSASFVSMAKPYVGAKEAERLGKENARVTREGRIADLPMGEVSDEVLRARLGKRFDQMNRLADKVEADANKMRLNLGTSPAEDARINFQISQARMRAAKLRRDSAEMMSNPEMGQSVLRTQSNLFGELDKSPEIKLGTGSKVSSEEVGSAQKMRARAISAILQHVAKDSKMMTSVTAKTISPDDLAWTTEGQNAISAIEPGDAPDLDALGWTLSRGGRRNAATKTVIAGGSRLARQKGTNETITKRVTALYDQVTGKVHLVSTWRRGSGEVRLVNPLGGTMDLREMPKRYTPIYTMMLGRALKGFHQVFDSRADFSKKFVNDAIERKRQASVSDEMSTYYVTQQEYQIPEGTEGLHGEGGFVIGPDADLVRSTMDNALRYGTEMTEPEARKVYMEFSQVQTDEQASDLINGLKDRIANRKLTPPDYLLISAIKKAAASVDERFGDELTDDQKAQQTLRELHDISIKSDNERTAIKAAKAAFGEKLQGSVEVPVTPPRTAVAVPATGTVGATRAGARELTMRERVPPTVVRDAQGRIIYAPTESAPDVSEVGGGLANPLGRPRTENDRKRAERLARYEILRENQKVRTGRYNIKQPDIIAETPGPRESYEQPEYRRALIAKRLDELDKLAQARENARTMDKLVDKLNPTPIQEKFWPNMNKRGERKGNEWYDPSVMTKDGEPITMFHGSPSDTIKQGEIKSPVFVTPKMSQARGYLGFKETPGELYTRLERYGKVYAAHIKFKKPLIVDRGGDGVEVAEAKHIFDTTDYDAIINRPANEYVMRNSDQVNILPDEATTRPAIQDTFFENMNKRVGGPGKVKEMTDALLHFGTRYDEWMADRIARLGGPNAKEAANGFRHIIDRAKEAYGSLTPVLDPARIKAGAPTRATRWIHQLNKMTKYAAVSNTPLAIEGKIDIPKYAQKLVDVASDANYAIGKMLEPVIPDFKASGAFQRNLTSLGYDILRSGPNGKMWNRWVEGILEANKDRVIPMQHPTEGYIYGVPISREMIQKHFIQWKDMLDNPGDWPDGIDKVNQDMRRIYPEAITHLKDGTGWHQVIHSNLFNYLETAAQRAAHVRAFREEFPQTTEGRAALRDVLRGARAELDAGGVADLHALMRTVQGHPTDNYSDSSLFSPNHLGGQAFRVLNQTFGSLMARAVLTAQIPTQMGETISGSTPIFLGARNYARALARVSQIYPEMEKAGMVNQLMRDWSYDPTSRIRTGFRLVGNSMAKLFVEDRLNEFQEAMAAATAQVVSEKIVKGELSNWEKDMLPQTFKAMGFDKGSVKKMMEGDEELLGQFKRRAATWLTSGNRAASEGSRIGGNRLFNSIFRFQSYPMMKMNQFRRVMVGFADAMANGTGREKLVASNLLGRFIAGNAMQGAMTTGIVAAFLKGSLGLNIFKSEAQDDPMDFLFNSFMASVGGPLYMLARGSRDSGIMGVGGQAARMVFPWAIASELIDASNGFGHYANKDAFEKTAEFIKSKTPGLQMFTTGLTLGGLALPSKDLDTAISAFYRWRRKELGFNKDETYLREDDTKEFRRNIAKAVDALQSGSDKFLDYFYEAAGANDRGPAGVKASLLGKTLLKGPDGKPLSDENLEKLRKRIGDRAYQKLEDWDMMLKFAANAIQVEPE